MKDKKIIPLTSNIMFKELFGKVENKEATAYLLSTLFELEYNEVLENIKYQNTNLEINNIGDYKFDTDVIVTLNNEISINIEMNKEYWKGIENRNLIYATNLFASQFKKGSKKEGFKYAKKVIQININNYNYPKEREYAVGIIKDIETNEVMSEMIQIYHINLVEIKKKCYNKNELNSIEKIGKLFLSEKISEVERIMGEDANKILEKIMELSSDERIVGLYDKEDLERQIKEGIEEAAFEKGIKESKKDIVVNMLKENVDINLISKVTRLNMEQINNIRKENNL